jgi:hypothetical protein
MFQMINTTPFAASSAYLFDRDGYDLAVAAVKGTFEIPENGKIASVPASEQVGVFWGDEMEGSGENAVIRYPSDLVPGKKGTDVGFAGTVYSPERKPVKSLKASIRVGVLYKDILVSGDRYWTKSLLRAGYKPSDPEPFVRMPLTWERVYGGRGRTKDGKELSFMENPAGTGFVLPGNAVGGTRLPNFEDPKKRMKTWRKPYPPATFGFSLPCADHRLPFAGTLDAAWADHRRPLYPEDMDLRYFNCAQPELISDGFLPGGETVTLTHLTPEGLCRFRLPRMDIQVSFRIKGLLEMKTAELHTVMIEPDLNRFYMTWWASQRIGSSPHHVDYIKVESVDE